MRNARVLFVSIAGRRRHRGRQMFRTGGGRQAPAAEGDRPVAGV
jgi:hypothetical protein